MEKFSLNAPSNCVGIAKSSYFYQRKALGRSDKYIAMREEIREIFNENKCVYGYRRIHVALKKNGIRLSEKVVRRLMHEEHLVVQGRKKRRYSSYLGEVRSAQPYLTYCNATSMQQDQMRSG
ncbi:MAG: transposase [Firmicutes bacterium]|nr:transposase [Bacillota bacterium]